MRLICPNCSAQYEIDVTLVPDEGRDVQCSNCGHTWFELPPPSGEMAELAPAPDDAPEPEDYDDRFGIEDDDERSDAPSQAAMAIAAATEDVTEPEQGAVESEPFKDVEDPFEAAASEFLPGGDDEEQDDQVDIGVVPTTTLKARRPADAADVDLLREEAQRELSQRRAPPSESLESQTDLGLDDISNRKTPSRALRARMARSSGNTSYEESTDAGSEDDYKAPQRDLLPDIDEINSTLKQNEVAADPAHVAAQRRGFRLGFGLMLLFAVASIVAYAFAPQIAQALPGTESALIRFVDMANQLRDWIDGLMA